VKSAVGKSVHGKNETIFLLQPILKILKLLSLELKTGLVRQSQAYPERFILADPFFDARNVLPQSSKVVVPAFSCVYVGAVGQVSVRCTHRR
jgi:hypothetical protein